MTQPAAAATTLVPIAIIQGDPGGAVGGAAVSEAPKPTVGRPFRVIWCVIFDPMRREWQRFRRRDSPR